MISLRRSVALPLIALLVAVTTVYVPSLTGDFIYDDQQNIVENESLRNAFSSIEAMIDAALSSHAGPLGRPIAMLTFAANYAVFGDDTLSFKIVNLLIHLLNSLLVFVLARKIVPLLSTPSGAARSTPNPTEVAIWAAAIWALHPINLTAVAYVVQRMASLSATFALLACCCYVFARTQMREQDSMGAWVWAAPCLLACTALAVFTKESGALIPLYIFTIEYFVFRGALVQRYDRWIIRAVVFSALLWIGCIFAPLELLSRMYESRPFDPAERFLTELRILFFYVYQILIPDLTSYSLFHDDVVLSKSLIEPVTTLFALAGWLAFLFVSFFYRNRLPLIGFGVTWYLAGHFLESLSVPLDLMYEHRNYIPSFGVVIAVVTSLATWLGNRMPSSQCRILFAIICAAFSAVTVVRAWQWGDPLTFALATARHSPNSQTAVYELARQYNQLYLRTGDNELWEKAIAELEKSVPLGNEDFNSLSAMVVAYDRRKKPLPEIWLKRYQESLATRTANKRLVSSLIRLTECQFKKKCALAPQLILKLSASLLSNPNLSRELKRDFLEALALYYVNLLGDFAAAEEILLEIVNEVPREPKYRLRLAEVYFAFGKYDAAAAQLSADVEKYSGSTLVDEKRFIARTEKLISDLSLARNSAAKVKNQPPR